MLLIQEEAHSLDIYLIRSHSVIIQVNFDEW